VDVRSALARVMARESLREAEMEAVFRQLMGGAASPAQIAGLLVALRMKGETVEELVGFATGMRRMARRVDPALNGEALLDTCGTGGDGRSTFNISTIAAFVVAGAGVRVAKHGNRSLSSKCGSADVMEALGVKISLPTSVLGACLEEVGIVFLFAPAMHTAMKYVQPARRELRLRTIFNLLGPLTNPARASAQVVGVYSLDLVEKVAEVLSMLGAHRALVVHGLDGLDEITITGPTRIAEVRDGNVRTYEVTPEEFGIKRAQLEDISGGDAEANAAIIREILAGKKSPRRDVVLLNASAALVAAGRAEHLGEALPLAAQSIDSGAAAAKLDALVGFTSTYI
jgi:anthranilate phosphoribosyltransferase